jgi:hypothetical protein
VERLDRVIVREGAASVAGGARLRREGRVGVGEGRDVVREVRVGGGRGRVGGGTGVRRWSAGDVRSRHAHAEPPDGERLHDNEIPRRRR